MSKTFGALNALSVPSVRAFEYMQMFCSAYSMRCTIFPSGYLHVSLTMCDVLYSRLHMDGCIVQCTQCPFEHWIHADVLCDVLNVHLNIEYMQMYCAMYSMSIWTLNICKCIVRCTLNIEWECIVSHFGYWTSGPPADIQPMSQLSLLNRRLDLESCLTLKLDLTCSYIWASFCQKLL